MWQRVELLLSILRRCNSIYGGRKGINAVERERERERRCVCDIIVLNLFWVGVLK